MKPNKLSSIARKAVVTAMVMMAGVMANAGNEYYLKFTKTDNTSVCFPAEGLKLTYDADHVIVHTGSTTTLLPLDQVRDMQFTTEHEVNVRAEDVNQDGEVNVADVNAVIDMILAGADTARGDVNGDGEVNIADVNAIIDRILGPSH